VKHTNAVLINDLLGLDLRGRHCSWRGGGKRPEKTTEDERNGGQLAGISQENMKTRKMEEGQEEFV
jgi:hypothetical protein